MQINHDCRYFNSDRPCHFHKQQGVHCLDCRYYERIDFKILIVKLEAIGDVLRTTCILPGLKEKYPQAQITWLTQRESLPLFDHNPYVDVVLDCSANSLVRLQVEQYDLVINLDAAPLSAQMATIAKGKEKLGFGYTEQGYVYPFNPEAVKWFEMGLSDSLKRANQQTYQEMMLTICRLKSSNYEVVFRLSTAEEFWVDDFAQRHNLTEGVIIGLNTGSGSRWPQKRWTQEGYLELIRLIQKEIDGAHILLFGGPEEVERNRYLIAQSSCEVIDTGCHNTLREFGALLSLCQIVVTGDTLALHLAVGLSKRVVALFGPTSAAEIDLYGRGEKVFADIDCLCCYQNDCQKHLNCMELISPKMVLTAIKKLI